MGRESISFEHAADFYDATRALSPEAQGRVAEVMLRELRRAGAERALEVGVGTGRMARPLAGRGVRICGVDMALAMLEKFREQLAPGAAPADLLLADATQLPLRTGAFRAAIVVHVMHLVSDWRAVLGELRRVLQPGGILIEHYTESDFGALEAGNEKWNGLLTAKGFQRRKRPEPAEIDAGLSQLGARVRVETVWEEQVVRTPAQDLEETRDRVHSWTWEIPDDVLRACLPEYEAWAQNFFGDLSRPFTGRVRHQLEVWTFPGG
ncbi:MAG: methyltransferase domain-containing protein [Chloroflexi bacterium]|nr:methyltransferase domain-containing protein [Chloroflexota bacterium]